MSPAELRVVIVGAGVGGLTLALLLRRRGITAEVVEQAPSCGRPARRSRWPPTPPGCWSTWAWAMTWRRPRPSRPRLSTATAVTATRSPRTRWAAGTGLPSAPRFTGCTAPVCSSCWPAPGARAPAPGLPGRHPRRTRPGRPGSVRLGRLLRRRCAGGRGRRALPGPLLGHRRQY